MRVILFLLSFAFFSFGSYTIDKKYEKGLEKLDNKDFLQAQKYFLEVTEKAPSYASFYNLGVVSGELEEWAQAKWAFESALKYRPSSGDAQYNAKFVSEKLTGNDFWTHPYPWSERLIVGLGVYTWLTLAVFSGVFIGFFTFQIISNQYQDARIMKWIRRLIIPVTLIFLLSVYGVVNYNIHFNKHQFVILKNDDVNLYISPNGIVLSDKLKSENRLRIIEYYEDSTWVQIKTPNEIYWTKTKDCFVY